MHGLSSDHRHLELTFSNDCSWDINIVKITTTAWQRINILNIIISVIGVLRYIMQD